jgi:hypothetical protein
MRFPIRSFATLALGVAVATCSDTPIAAVRTGSTPATRIGLGQLALRPEFSRTAAAVYSQLAAAGVNYDNVHVAVRDPLDTTKTVKDTIVSFSSSQDSLPVDMTVPVTADGQRFDAGLDYRNGQQSLFSGHIVVQSYRPGDAAPPTPPLVLNYTGPGANAVRIQISPRGANTNANGSASFSILATDAGGAQVTVPPIAWSISDASLASVSTDGVVTGKGRRGTVTLTAAFGTITDQVPVNFTLPPSRINLVSGSGQSGKSGATLSAPAVVQVLASDNAGVSGVNVIFSAPAGGSVTPTSTTTDVNGRASATLKLGSAVGPQSFAATAAGFSVGIPEAATPADPSAITIVSGGTQSDTVRKTLAPLVVKIADAFGNPVSGVSVSWARTSGSGTLGAASTTTNNDGQSTNSYTLGASTGSEGVSASVAGVTTPAAFSFTATAAAPASIAIVSGDAQTGRVNESLADPLAVRVTDAAGNGVTGATVNWTATNGTLPTTSTTDADGKASNTLTLGTAVGPAAAKASIGTAASGSSVTFAAIVTPGVVAKLEYTSQPANATAGVALGTIRVALRDFGGNPTIAVNPVTIALGSNTGAATITGTLTRNAVNGVATFDDLKIDHAGTGYTLVATSGSLSATSQTFNVATAAASTITVLAGDNQLATVNTVVPVAPSVRITDASGNVLPGLSVTFTPSAGSVSPSGAVSTNASGIATLTSWTLGTAAGAQSLVVSIPGLPSVTLRATANAGAAAALHVTTQPSASATSGVALARQPVLRLVDLFGNAVPAGNMSVNAAAIGSSITVSGQPATSDALTGVTTFTSLTLSGSGSTRIVFSEGSGGIKPDTSATISLGSSGPTQLVLDPSSPTTFTFNAGSPPSSIPKLKTLDVAGAAVGNVPLHIDVAVNGVSVGSKDTTTDASGELRPPPSMIPTVAGTYVLTATSSAIPGASRTLTFNVQAGAASKLMFTTAPASVTAGAGFNVVVAVTDAFGNVVSGPSGSISLSLTPPGGITAALGGASSGSSQSGGVTFSSLTLTKAANGYAITATSDGGLTPATTASFNVSAGAAAKYAVTANTTPLTGSTNTAITATLIDAFNNVIATPAPHTVNWSIGAGGVGLLSSASSSTSSLGQATVTYNAPASAGGTAIVTAADAATPSVLGNVTLIPTAPGGIPTTMTVQAGAGQSATVNTAVATAPSVLIKDGNNNPVPGVSVTFAPASGSGSVSPASGVVTTNALGVATLTSWTVGTGAGQQSLSVAASGLANQTINATAVAGAPAALKFAATPASTTAGTAFSATVGAIDAFGNATSGATGDITVSLSPSSGVLGGTLTRSSPSGSATFTGLTVSKAGTAYTLRATSAAGYSAAVTAGSFSITAGAARKLAFTAQPSSAAAGATMAPIVVQIQDSLGNVVSGATNSVTLSPSPVTTIRGTATLAAVNGVATFSSVIIDVANTYSFTVASSGLTSSTSASFGISTAGVNSIEFFNGHGLPGSVDNDASFGNGPQIIALDAARNPVSGVTIDAIVESTASGATAPGPNAEMFAAFAGLPSFFSNGSLVSSISQTTGNSGIADFSAARMRGLVQSFRIKFTVRGSTIAALTGGVALHHGSATNAICTATMPGVVRPGHALSVSPRFAVTDVSGNVVDNTALTLDVTSGGALGATSVTTDASGNIAGPAWTVGNTEGAHAVNVHGVSGSCSVTARKAHHVKLTGVPTTIKNGEQFPAIDAEVQDSLGTAIEDETFALTMDTRSGPGTHFFGLTGNSPKSSNGHGKSTFSGVGVDADAQTGAKVVFTDGVTGVSGTSLDIAITNGALSSLSAVGSTDMKVRSPSLNTSNLPKVSVRDFNSRNSLSLENVTIIWTFKNCGSISFPSLTGAVLQISSSQTDKAGQASSPSITVPERWDSTACTLEATIQGVATLAPVVFTIHK